MGCGGLLAAALAQRCHCDVATVGLLSFGSFLCVCMCVRTHMCKVVLVSLCRLVLWLPHVPDDVRWLQWLTSQVYARVTTCLLLTSR